jgi:hypothetical protein
MAHVGSPDTFFVGTAGPYPVRVIVRLPGVIPGRAQVSVRVTDEASAKGVQHVTLRASQWNLGIDGAPPPEPAVSVPGDPTLYAAELWFMTATSYQMFVSVDGAHGNGTAVVPVLAIATEERPMARSLGLVLAALGVFLSVGMLTIVGCAIRESDGQIQCWGPSSAEKERLRLPGQECLSPSCSGRQPVVDRRSLRLQQVGLFRPFDSRAAVRDDGMPRLALEIQDERWAAGPVAAGRYNALMPDHGKLMHLFPSREPRSMRSRISIRREDAGGSGVRRRRAAAAAGTLPGVRGHRPRKRLRPDARVARRRAFAEREFR